MRAAAEYVQTRPLSGSHDRIAHTPPPPFQLSYFISSIHGYYLLPCLAFLFPQLFAGIANTLLLVHIGGFNRPEIRRHLADEALVYAFDIDESLLIHLHINSSRH